MDLSNNNELGHPISKLDKKFIFYAVGAIIFLLLGYFFFLSTPKDFPEGVMIDIKEGSSLRSISFNLEQNNIIRSRTALETFIVTFGGEKRVASGNYLFERKMPVFEVARRLSEDERHLTLVKVTIPEGFNLSDISKLFTSKLPDFNENKFLSEAEGKEGHLFPDTYFFFITDDEETVLKSMNNNFKKKIVSLQSEITLSGKTEEEIMIMASLIEEESKGDNDREFISGILWKRIALGIPLQVDAEPDTYKEKGLPENPISNPGMKAIEAAIYPKSSSYLYYLHDKDGNIHYAKTFAEHKLNKFKYLKN